MTQQQSQSPFSNPFGNAFGAPFAFPPGPFSSGMFDPTGVLKAWQTEMESMSKKFAAMPKVMQAAMKAVPLGQAAGQRLLAALADAIPACAEATLDMPDEDRIAFLPGLAIASARHETQYSRLFRSRTHPHPPPAHRPPPPCTALPAAPGACHRCAWASAGRSARARPPWWRCCARPCASAGTWWW